MEGERWFAMPLGEDVEEPAPWRDVRHVAIIGAGQMGVGIAEVSARAGLEVTVIDVDSRALEMAKERLSNSMEKAVRRGKLDEQSLGATLRRVAFSADWGLTDGADAAFEAVVESEQVKREVFKELDRRLPDALFLASNTSSVPIMKLARATDRPDRVLGLHFFNPVPVMDLVEVVPALSSSRETVALAEGFVRGVLGKAAIRAPDRAGFVVNALLIPYVLCAVRMVEMGPASKEEIDRGMVKGCHHPMGPLALADLIGLDTVLAVSGSLYDEFHDPFYSAPPLLRRMVEAGMLGRKVGRGFYEYSDASHELARTASPTQ
jgi:3-hydroxybutyryl-CoA dehydrogenase